MLGRWVIILAIILPASAETPLTIKLIQKPDSALSVGSKLFIDQVARRSNGRYRLEIQNIERSTERALIELVQQSTFDLIHVSNQALGDFFPKLRVLEIPFLFRDYSHVHQVLDGPLGQAWLNELRNKELMALAWTERGFQHIATRQHNIISPEEMRLLRLYSNENHFVFDALSLLGSDPIWLPDTELPLALKRGRIDGSTGLLVTLEANAAHIRHVSLTHHLYSAGLIMMSAKRWESLPDYDRQIFIDAAKAASTAQRQAVRETDLAILAALRGKGVAVMPYVDTARFRQVLAPQHNALAQTFGSALKQIAETKDSPK